MPADRIVDFHVSDLADEHRLVDESGWQVRSSCTTPRRCRAPPRRRADDRPAPSEAFSRRVPPADRRVAVIRPSPAATRPRRLAFHFSYGVLRWCACEGDACPARHDFGLRYLRTDLPGGYATGRRPAPTEHEHRGNGLE